jgi:acyl-coenzyme A synthetase/AMP-(fatty) acid ligase
LLTFEPPRPEHILYFLQHPNVSKYDLSSVEFVDCAAAPLSSPLQRALSARLGVSTIRNGYGLSETVAAAIIPVPGQAAEMMRKGSVGIPIPGVEVGIHYSILENM